MFQILCVELDCQYQMLSLAKFLPWHLFIQSTIRSTSCQIIQRNACLMFTKSVRSILYGICLFFFAVNVHHLVVGVTASTCFALSYHGFLDFKYFCGSMTKRLKMFSKLERTQTIEQTTATTYTWLLQYLYTIKSNGSFLNALLRQTIGKLFLNHENSGTHSGI